MPAGALGPKLALDPYEVPVQIELRAGDRGNVADGLFRGLLSQQLVFVLLLLCGFPIGYLQAESPQGRTNVRPGQLGNQVLHGGSEGLLDT
jgi:hypothetical protein